MESTSTNPRLGRSDQQTFAEGTPLEGPQLLRWIMYLFSYADDTPFRPDWWQSIYIKNTDRFFIANKSRRVGWSYITAAKGLGIALDPNRNNYTKQYVSYSLEDAIEKIKNAAEFYDSIPEHKRPKKIIGRSKTRLEFLDRNGRSVSRLISLPCKQPRGKGGDISLDEFAFHARDNEIYTAALPVISRGGSIEIGSTPFGNKGKFYEIYTGYEDYAEYTRYNIPWYFSSDLCVNVTEAAKNKDLTTEDRIMLYGTDIIKKIFRSTPIDDFRQEFECYYRDDLAAFITLDMIRACTPLGGNEIDDEDSVEIRMAKRLDDFIIDYDPAIHGSLYAGYDVGRTNDAAELFLLGHNPATDKKTVWCNVSLKKTPFDDQEAVLHRMMTQLPIHRLAIDATGIGMQLAEHMSQRYGKKVEACMFTNEFKETMANAVWLSFNRLEYALPADKELAQQIHSIKKSVTAGKHARFDCDANEKHHADKFWSMALATYAIVNGPTNPDRSRFFKDLQDGKGGGERKEDSSRGISQATAIRHIARRYGGIR